MFIVIDCNGKRLCCASTYEKAVWDCDMMRRYFDYYSNIRWID